MIRLHHILMVENGKIYSERESFIRLSDSTITRIEHVPSALLPMTKLSAAQGGGRDSNTILQALPLEIPLIMANYGK